jgi:hypothetical protein
MVSYSGPEMACCWHDDESMPLHIQRAVVDYYHDLVLVTKCTGAEVDQIGNQTVNSEFYQWNIVVGTD